MGNATFVETREEASTTGDHPRTTKPLSLTHAIHKGIRGNGKRLYAITVAIAVPPYAHAIGMVVPKLRKGNPPKHEAQDDRVPILAEVVVPFVVPRFI